MHSLATYNQQFMPQQLGHHHQHKPHKVRATPGGQDSDIFFNNYSFEPRSAYGGNNTPDLSRSPYNSRVPQMGVSASGHRRTLSSNFSGYSQNYFGTPTHVQHTIETVTSKNPFLNMVQSQPQPQVKTQITPNRMYENVPFSPNRHLYSLPYDRMATMEPIETESAIFQRGSHDSSGTVFESKLRSSLKKKMNGGAPSIEPQDRSDHSFSSSGSRVRFSPEHSGTTTDGKSFSST